MALNSSQKYRNKISHECGTILVAFVNADSLKDAIFNLDESFQKVFKVKIFNAQKEFIEERSISRKLNNG